MKYLIRQFSLLLISVTVTSCCKEVIPVLTTSPVLNINSTSVTTGGKITSNGGAAVTERGVCWSAEPDPTIDGQHTSDGSGSGTFTSVLSCLVDIPVYYVRAYATNSVGTSYGNQLTFNTKEDPILFNPSKTYGLISDIDGNCYKTIQIGNETWMAENLRTSRYNDGTLIPNVTDNTQWEHLLNNIYNEPYITTGAYCWYNNDSTAYENVYGKLYNFGVVSSGKICPVGWHVPYWVTNLDNTIISEDCYFSDYLGGGMMETGSKHWINPMSACITNETGFTAVPGGKRASNGIFSRIGEKAYFWCTTPAGHGPLVIYQMVPHSASYCHSPTSCGILPTEGLSIRCVKDN